MDVVRRRWDQGRDYEEVAKAGSSATRRRSASTAPRSTTPSSIYGAGTQIAVPLVDAKQHSGNDGVDYTVEFYQYRWGGARRESRLKFWWTVQPNGSRS